VRLVKLWARKHDINDSANGSLNSFALTLLVGGLGWVGPLGWAA
jgi:DNA polymerase sigma